MPGFSYTDKDEVLYHEDWYTVYSNMSTDMSGGTDDQPMTCSDCGVMYSRKTLVACAEFEVVRIELSGSSQQAIPLDSEEGKEIIGEFRRLPRIVEFCRPLCSRCSEKENDDELRSLNDL